MELIALTTVSPRTMSLFFLDISAAALSSLRRVLAERQLLVTGAMAPAAWPSGWLVAVVPHQAGPQVLGACPLDSLCQVSTHLTFGYVLRWSLSHSACPGSRHLTSGGCNISLRRHHQPHTLNTVMIMLQCLQALVGLPVKCIQFSVPLFFLNVCSSTPNKRYILILSL